MPTKMWVTFAVSMAGFALLWATLVKFELTAKNASAQLRRLRRALDAPAPSSSGTSSRIAPELG
jgi:hypothetical protein